MAFVALTIATLLAVSFAADPNARLPPPVPIVDNGQPQNLQAPIEHRQGLAERVPIQGQQGFSQRPPIQGQGVDRRPPIRGSNSIPQSMPQTDSRQGRQFVGGFGPYMGYGGYGRYSAFGPMGGMGMSMGMGGFGR